MFCSNCGTQVPDNAAFCSNCGNAVSAQPVAAPVAEPVAAPVAEPVVVPVEESVPVATPVAQPTYNAALEYQAVPAGVCPTDTSILVKGIISVAFLCTFYFSFIGIIFGALAVKAADKFTACTGKLSAKARIGRILGKVGMITSIVFTAIVAIVLIAIAAGA